MKRLTTYKDKKNVGMEHNLFTSAILLLVILIDPIWRHLIPYIK